MAVAATPGDALIHRLWSTLKARGFKKRDATFRKPIGEVVHLVSLQSSTSNTRNHVRVTLNLAVWCNILDGSGAAPSVSTAHWKSRIGDLMPVKSDLWWALPQSDEHGAVSAEILSALEEYGLPALDGLANSASLLALWESGKSPGLTRVQAARYSELLRAGIG